MNKSTRANLLASLAAIVVLLALFFSFEPLARAWRAFARPSEPAVVRGLASPDVEDRRHALSHSGFYRPGSDALLRAFMSMARTEPDGTLRRQAIRSIGDQAGMRALPEDVMSQLAEGPGPETPADIAAAFVEALGRAAAHSPVAPLGVARLQGLLADDIDGEIRNAAVIALGEIGLRQALADEIPLRVSAIAEQRDGPRFGALGTADHAVWALKLIGMRGPLPGESLAVLERLATAHADRHVRFVAVLAVATQLPHHPRALATLQAALKDADDEVHRTAKSALVEFEGTSPAERDRMARMTLDRAQPRKLENDVPAPAPDPRLRYVGWLFRAIVTIAIGTGLAFLVYFVARAIVCLTQRSWKALAALAVALFWGGLSYGLGMAIFVVLMGLGHNRAPSLSQQFLFDLILGAVILLYGAVGWGLHRIVRS